MKPDIEKILELICSESEEDALLGANILLETYPEKIKYTDQDREESYFIPRALWKEIGDFRGIDELGMYKDSTEYDVIHWRERLTKFKEIFKT